MKNKLKITAFCVAVGLAALLSFFSVRHVAYAAENDGDGTYSVAVDLSGLAMGKDNFTENATVEKIGDKYYFTFGFSSKIGYANLSVGGADSNKKVGKTTEKKDGWTYHTYTLSEANLNSVFSISAYINAMKTETSFGISLKWNSRTKTSDETRDLGERPAEFVPVISSRAAADYSLKVGTVFPVPETTAAIGEEKCEVSVTVTHNGENIEVVGGKFSLETEGTYILSYRATSDKYKTSLGNDTFTEYVSVIEATTGENDAVKLEDFNKILPEKTSVLAGKIDEKSSEYALAASAMEKISDNFEVFSAELIGENGETIMPDGFVKLLFRADDYFDRTEIKVCHLDENGGITELSAKGYGRYVSAETNKTGTFIVYVPGVSFGMFVRGYALILVGAVVLIVAAAVVAIILVKKNKKAKKK